MVDTRDGMTNETAEAMVAEVMQAKREITAAFLAGDHARVAELKLECENINNEARRLNKIRQQKITGVMGAPPRSRIQGVAHG